MDGFYHDGIRTLVLFGVADTAEVVFAAIKNTSLVVIGVVDSDPAKQGQPFNGLIVKEPHKLEEINPDAVVITSFGQQDEIHECIRELIGEKIKVLRLTEV
jgi:hypothetical protein